MQLKQASILKNQIRIAYVIVNNKNIKTPSFILFLLAFLQNSLFFFYENNIYSR